MTSWIYGLNNANHQFDTKKSFGKNIFTNAFPLSIAQYLSIKKNLPIVEIRATNQEIVMKDENGHKQKVQEPTTEHKKTSWKDIIGCDPMEAYFEFEHIYEGYRKYTDGKPNQSDVVVCKNSISKSHKRPLEIKLVVVPTSNSAENDRADQSCEIVCRPSTIEQLAFSIANSYGEDGRMLMQQTILQHISRPMDFKWSEETYMKKHINEVQDAVKGVIKNGLEKQTPLVLTAVWRTEGQRPTLDEHAFDAFVWTDLAFLQLFTDSKTISGNKISRPARTLCWLVKSLLDWSMQGSLQFDRHHSEITYGTQTDKAGAFTGKKTLRHMQSVEFEYPRLSREEIPNLLNKEAIAALQPERRLDAALTFEQSKQEALESAEKKFKN